MPGWLAIAAKIIGFVLQLFGVGGSKGPSDSERAGRAEQKAADQGRTLDEIQTATAARARADDASVREPSSVRATDPFSRD